MASFDLTRYVTYVRITGVNDNPYMPLGASTDRADTGVVVDHSNGSSNLSSTQVCSFVTKLACLVVFKCNG